MQMQLLNIRRMFVMALVQEYSVTV